MSAGAACALASVTAWCPAQAAKFAHMHRLGPNIRVFYDTTGMHAVNSEDADRTGVPDQVEDIAKQAWAARALFVDALGFPDPFHSPHFRGAAFLDIHLLHRSVLGANGKAFDEPQRFRRAGDPPATVSLCFNVATSVKASANATPAHEFFHLVQSGATRFKNAWFSEGMARWSEKGLTAGGLGGSAEPDPWSLADAAGGALFRMSYDAAERFWNPLAARLDPSGALPAGAALPAGLRQLRYANGAKVLEDLQFTGWELMRSVLLALDEVDDAAFRELGYERWSEPNQNSARNNGYILLAVRKCCEERRQPKP